jgi:NAD(P)-dependent dehydrogenase (short-subunit alcohol dehydrogenase family)
VEESKMRILEGKAAVVTGGGRGVGRGECLHLAAQGASVVVNDVDGEEAQKVVQEIRAAGGRAVANGSDIGTRKGAQELVAQCVDEFGAIHAVVNNAGIVRDKSFLKMSDDEWEIVLRIHAGGSFRCAQEGALRMRDQGTGGAIVNTVSAAQMGNFGQTNYSAAKGAIASMTYTWANELSRYGIRVNAISPLATTRMSATAKGADGKEHTGVFFDPNLNGPFVAYLCSDEASWITGQVFGTGGDRVVIMRHPRYDTGMFQPGGWDVDALREQMPKFWKAQPQLEPVGLHKKPYPYYGGIAPEGKES